VSSGARGPAISVMLAVADATAAAAWYTRAFGAVELWSLGSVVGLEIDGAPFFVGQPEGGQGRTPERAGGPTCRVEVFCDDPDSFVRRAVESGARSDDPVRDHEAPWGRHRQGGFVDPFGHRWLVGDRSPLRPSPERVAAPSPETPSRQAQTVTPQFRITESKRSLAFYVDGLGFRVDWEHRFEPGFPVFMGLSRAGQSIFLSEHTGDCEIGGAAYFVIGDVDVYCREIESRGIVPKERPEDAPWGAREMLVVDPDGNRLRFANPVAAET